MVTMKLTIDTERKVIEVESTVKVGDLIEALKQLLGKDWEEYSIEQKWTYWNYPLVTYTDNRFQPPYDITCGSMITISA